MSDDLGALLRPQKRRFSQPVSGPREMTEFTVLGDASFAPSGKHSQSGYTIHLSFGTARQKLQAPDPRAFYQGLGHDPSLRHLHSRRGCMPGDAQHDDYVPTDLQIADPMTKPTSVLISSNIFSSVGSGQLCPGWVRVTSPPCHCVISTCHAVRLHYFGLVFASAGSRLSILGRWRYFTSLT